jgi:hypothetical protein
VFYKHKALQGTTCVRVREDNNKFYIASCSKHAFSGAMPAPAMAFNRRTLARQGAPWRPIHAI